MAADVVSILDARDYRDQIDRAASLLREGGLVVLPTETVYGAAACLTNRPAMEKLRALPPAASGKPLVIHLGRSEDARRYLGPLNEYGQRLLHKLFPGPVSLQFEVTAERQAEVARELGVGVEEIYDNGSITLRCPSDLIFSDVVGEVKAPVVVRRAGADEQAQQPRFAQEEWGGQVDLIFDCGPTRYAKPSTLVKVRADSYEIARAGVFDQRIIDRLLKTTVLFVCSGNTCRSPMAEAITRKLLSEKLGVGPEELEKKGLNVISAGSFAFPGAKASAPAVEAMKHMGADLSKHRSRPLSVELIHQADHIFTMGRSHKQAVLSLVPSAAEKVATLDPDRDIEDPIGGDVELYESLAEHMRKLIEQRLTERSVMGSGD